MDLRKLIIIPVLLFWSLIILAQNNTDYIKADSLSWKLYETGEWKELLIEGNKLIKQQSDFPNLRLRMAYAAFILSDFGEAKKHYTQVLKEDSYNQFARYYLQLCETYLNHPLAANYHQSYLQANDDTTSKLAIRSLTLESGIKSPATVLRKNGYYNRISLGTQLGWKIFFDQSLSFFGQQLAVINAPGNGTVDYSASKQFEYYGKLSYALSARWSAWAGYHYLNTNFLAQRYHSNIGLGGLKISGNYLDVQADASIGNLTGLITHQYNAMLTYFPLGNLNLYGITRISLHSDSVATETIISQVAGFKLSKKIWFEASGSFGRLNNFLEVDGLYVYNSIDPSTSKLGTSLLYQLGRRSLLQLNYTQEKKQNITQNTNFNQHSLTTSISWKF
ncbi:MAG: hypothetical protein H7Y13_06955 [Sphingobacteriaceae bacterium]|nr:hypothetical protein [Sphingobacteriaceae bacterium]